MSDLVVVTGASRGIGRATARAFAERGLAVALVSRASDELEDAVNSVRAFGGTARGYECDVAREDHVDEAARAILGEMGAPRVVVNNAGIVKRGADVAKTRVEDWDEVIAVNLRGSFLVARAFLPAMLEKKSGRILQVASVSSTIGSPGAASYAASKWGAVGLAKSLAEELRGTGVQSIAILPGSVDTTMLEGSGFHPMMTAEDVAKTIVFLALDAPDALHGAAVEMFGAR